MEEYQKYLESIKQLIVDPEFLEWYKQQPIDFTSRCEYVRAALVWNTAYTFFARRRKINCVRIKEKKFMKEINIRDFLLKKFPTNKYFDCPIPKEHLSLFDEYADTKAIQVEAKVKPEKKNILMKLFGKHSQINMVSDTRYLSESDFINLIHDKSFPLDDSSVL